MAFSDEQKAAITELRKKAQNLREKTGLLAGVVIYAEGRVIETEPMIDINWTQAMAWLTSKLNAARTEMNAVETDMVAYFQTMGSIP